jgi:hypothetical protein
MDIVYNISIDNKKTTLFFRVVKAERARCAPLE